MLQDREVNLIEYIFSIVREYESVGIFITLILEFIGLPIPGEPLMGFIGYINSDYELSVIVVPIIFSILGTMIGSICAYYIGYKYGEIVLVKYGKYVFITEKKIRKTKEKFKKNDIILFLLGKYIPGVRHVVPYMAGISKTNVYKFVAFNLLGSLIWCISFICLGYFLGSEWTAIEKTISRYTYVFVGVVVVFFVIWKFFRKKRKKGKNT